MDGDFWNCYGWLFVVGLIFWPRVLLLFYGAIKPHSLAPIFGLIFFPRIFLATLLSANFWDTNQVIVTICWIIAVIIDVIALIIKTHMQRCMFRAAKETREAMLKDLESRNSQF